MPPRRRKAAGEDDRCPTLKLKMLKGPLSGQTSEFSPRSVVRIGRYVRGNTLAIKDFGISSKHLLIQAEAAENSSQRRWIITDVGSSNGTILNGEKLESPAALKNGDVIKIGEETSITVEFDGDESANLGVVDELGHEKEIDVVAEVEVIPKRNVSKKTTKNSKNTQVNKAELKDSNNDEKEIDDVAEVEVIQERNVSKKATKDSKNSQVNNTELKDLNTEENKDLGRNGVKEQPVVNTRRTRSSRKEGDAIEAAIDLSVIEGRKPRGRKKKVVETIPEETENVAEEVNSSKEDGACELGSTSGVKETNVNTGKGKMVADLETMTMGEWLDFLEVYLPQQIIEETEAQIAEMRRTAERYHEYTVQQKKLMGKK